MAIPLTLRLVKGSKLTFAELDNNFVQLRNAIGTLTDLYVTGGTYNPSTVEIDFVGNTGFNPFSVDVSGLLDTYVNNGVYDNNTGCVTFSTTSGYTFEVCGFLTGMTQYWTDGSSGNYSIKTINDSSVDATGNYAVAEGYNTIASGEGSHAEGYGGKGNVTASGLGSHAEGFSTTASGSSSHAEGLLTIASGESSHAEGQGTLASGGISHAEGVSTTASGTHSHAEGQETIASGTTAHAEGFQTSAGGDYSHAEGRDTVSSGEASHAEGRATIASGNYSHAEGAQTTASGERSHVEGSQNTSSGFASHAEGIGTQSSNNGSHAEGQTTNASGEGSHAEGQETQSIGQASHAENRNTIAYGFYSHAGGESSVASGYTSFIHSTNSLVTGDRSVVLGGQNITGTTSDTVYVPYLNINNLGTGTSVNNLGIDSNGFVVSGTSSSSIYWTSQTGALVDTNTTIAHTTLNTNTDSIIGGGRNNKLDNSDNASIIGGFNNNILTGDTSLIIGGQNNDIQARSGSNLSESGILGGNNNNIVDTTSDSDRSFIIGGINNNINDSTNSTIIGSALSNITNTSTYGFIIGSTADVISSTQSGVIGGTGNVINNADRSVIIGGQDITGTTNDTVYVPNLNINNVGGATPITNLGIDSNGNVVSGTTGGGTSGVLGISNSGGTYTYYSDFASAIAAASAGDTIEMFADIEETGSVTVTLKDGVKINGNGHSYTLSVNDTTNAFTVSTSGDYELYNLKVIRTGRTAGTTTGFAILNDNALGYLRCFGVYFINDFGYSCNGRGKYYGVYSVAYLDAIRDALGNAEVYDSYAESTGTGIGINTPVGYIYNSIGKGVSNHGIVSNGTIYNSTGISTGGYGISSQNANSCVAISSTNYGGNGNFKNSTLISVSNYGAFRGTHLNCSIISSSAYGINEPVSLNNCYVESSSNVALSFRDNSNIVNSTINCKWNNTGGHATRSSVLLSNPIVANTSLKVANASAYCLNMFGGSTLRYANNSFQGATTPVNPTINQGITNTSDAQGNTLI